MLMIESWQDDGGPESPGGARKQSSSRGASCARSASAQLLLFSICSHAPLGLEKSHANKWPRDSGLE
jgi:hypothetical protein